MCSSCHRLCCPIYFQTVHSYSRQRLSWLPLESHLEQLPVRQAGTHGILQCRIPTSSSLFLLLAGSLRVETAAAPTVALGRLCLWVLGHIWHPHLLGEAFLPGQILLWGQVKEQVNEWEFQSRFPAGAGSKRVKLSSVHNKGRNNQWCLRRVVSRRQSTKSDRNSGLQSWQGTLHYSKSHRADERAAAGPWSVASQVNKRNWVTWVHWTETLWNLNITKAGKKTSLRVCINHI